MIIYERVLGNFGTNTQFEEGEKSQKAERKDPFCFLYYYGMVCQYFSAIMRINSISPLLSVTS